MFLIGRCLFYCINIFALAETFMQITRVIKRNTNKTSEAMITIIIILAALSIWYEIIQAVLK